MDASDGALDRKALSFGARHENETGLSLSGRVELRRDRGETQETDRDSDALFFVGSGRYIINDDQRLVFSLDYADTDTDGASLSSGEYYDAQAGYAYRPALDDRLNMLFRAVRHAQLRRTGLEFPTHQPSSGTQVPPEGRCCPGQKDLSR